MVKNNGEFRAYHFIYESLKEISWIIKYPNINSSGQVFTQYEALQNASLKNISKRKVPKNIIKLDDNL